MRNYEKRVGEVSKNRYDSLMKIVAYHSAINVDVIFENGYTTNCYYYDFKHGRVLNPFDKSMQGVGYFGIGEHHSEEKSYIVWADIFKRCYSEKYLLKYESYRGCTVCEEWHNYQNFAEWHDINYPTNENYKFQLDKDILCKGNKVYSPENCVYLPEEINYIILGRNKSRGEYPIGVYLHNDKDKYVAQSHDINKRMVYLGRYDTVNAAFLRYKKYKEQVIKQVADKYRDIIPEKAYRALYNYKVEITD